MHAICVYCGAPWCTCFDSDVEYEAMRHNQQCTAVASFAIRVGAVYVYAADLPRGCRGHRYRVEAFVLDVPVNIDKVLVRCLSGPDEGLLFTVSPMNFARRYKVEEASDGQP